MQSIRCIAIRARKVKLISSAEPKYLHQKLGRFFRTAFLRE
jgi:hypothetical protein